MSSARARSKSRDRSSVSSGPTQKRVSDAGLSVSSNLPEDRGTDGTNLPPTQSIGSTATSPALLEGAGSLLNSIVSERRESVPNSALVKDSPVLLSKFTLYETRSHFYIVGSNTRETRFRVLVIRLDGGLQFSEPYRILPRNQVMQLLEKLETEARATGDTLTKRLTSWGILGCIRFTDIYYLCLVTKCSPVALLGGHFIFHIDETNLIPLVHSSAYHKPERRSTEGRLLSTFHNLDLSKTFYFSHSYDLTQTLQTNLLREKREDPRCRQEIYVWNSHLLQPVADKFEHAMEWCVSIIHGFIDQAKISVFGNSVFITLIARRSHYFAGARFFKRGVNNEGHVANEVETEQIVSNHLISSFHDPRVGQFNSPRYSSYVQHRGSICLKWSQFPSNMSPKPPIILGAMDPYYAPAARHFDHMFQRYGTTIQVFNLVKQRERRPRESGLSAEFKKCISYLNQFLPDDKKIGYTEWDMSRAAKDGPERVFAYLEKHAKKTLETTGFFHNGATLETTKLQEGICRTNCIDCLDRTNAAQSVVAKCALGYQLQAIGIIDTSEVAYDTDVVDLLTEMWHDHGDTLALQYGGSNLVNTVETYRKINHWSSHSRDLIESFRRFYSNSFFDAQRQDAINLFLGNYQVNKYEGVNLWDLSTDYYLHNIWSFGTPIRSYREWFTPLNLLSIRERVSSGELFRVADGTQNMPLPTFRLQFEHHWNRIYRPRVLTTLANMFILRMNSTDRYKQRDKITSPLEVHGHTEKSTLDPPRVDEFPGEELQSSSLEASDSDTEEEFYESYVSSAIKEPVVSQYGDYSYAQHLPKVDEDQYEKWYSQDLGAPLDVPPNEFDRYDNNVGYQPATSSGPFWETP